MKRIFTSGVFLLFGLALSGAAPGASPRELVARAVQAMGGEAALERIRTLAIHGEDVQWEIESSYEPGARAKPRQGAESRFFVQRDLVSGAARIDWERRVVRTPKPLLFNYSEILAGGIGYVSGVDSASRTHASRMSDPPGHPMSGARAAATLRELARQSPRLLLEMQANPKSLKALAPQNAGARRLPAVQYDVRDWSFIVLFDPETGLPARIRTRDADPIQGDSNYDLALDDWREVGGARLAHALTYKLNERDMVAIRYQQVALNPALDPALFEIPIFARALAVRAAMGAGVPYQWIIRRGYWGNLMDSDAVAWDASARPEPELVDIAPGVSLSQGVSHNSMVVEMDRYLVVLDAPIGEAFSEWMIRASKKRYPGKPIRYLMLTHHHWDHANGARTYVAEGATVIVGQGNKEHFARVFSAPATIANDRLQRNPRKANIIEVTGKHVLKDRRRSVEIYLIESQHSIGTLIAYVPDARLGFVTDIWSTNAPLGAKPTPGQMELVAGVKKWGIRPERFAHGHGSPAPFAPLLELAGG
ncbi:MAG TPA: MBL fold metallo-hydrolase [Burkholderiales bacterium]|nr:MBL fold metallo-hydrolase [Burkholderiales bacterium]